MKTSISCLRAARLPVLGLLLLFCCSDPDTDEVTPPTQGGKNLTPAELDAALESISFESSEKIVGSVPTVINSSLVKTNYKDTIYVLPGIKNLLQLSHPEGRPIKGVYFTATGSSFYYNAAVFDEDESDTLSTIIFELDPADLEGSLSVPVEVTPYDDADQPIDIIERIITVENPSKSGCSILQDGDTAVAETNYGWNWRWSVIVDMNDQPINITVPGKRHTNDFTYEGCCKGTACPTQVLEQGVRKWKYDKEFEVSTYYTLLGESFYFYKNGTFRRLTTELSSGISNADADTDWCTEEPVISDYADWAFYYGIHTYAPGDASISYSTTHSNCDDPSRACGYSSRGGDLTSSCHAMIITTLVEGQRSMRMYTRQYGSWAVTKDGNLTWIP